MPIAWNRPIMRCTPATSRTCPISSSNGAIGLTPSSLIRVSSVHRWDAGQGTLPQGTAGEALVSVFQGPTLLWRFVVVRPSVSSGLRASWRVHINTGLPPARLRAGVDADR